MTEPIFGYIHTREFNVPLGVAIPIGEPVLIRIGKKYIGKSECRLLLSSKDELNLLIDRLMEIRGMYD